MPEPAAAIWMADPGKIKHSEENILKLANEVAVVTGAARGETGRGK